MSTSLHVYQSLALSDRAALSLRKHASRRLLAMEQRLDELESERLTIEGAMRRDSLRRPTAVGVVNATSDAVGATERPRVADSHDARPGSARASERPYSEATYKRDVAYGRAPAARCSACTTTTAPLWALALDADDRAKLSTAPRHFADASDQESERAAVRVIRGRDGRSERAAAMRAAATSAKLTR
jgi:hypothetical protein